MLSKLKLSIGLFIWPIICPNITKAYITGALKGQTKARVDTNLIPKHEYFIFEELVNEVCTRAICRVKIFLV